MASAGTMDIRETVALARAEAHALSSPRIEAEHLLLALATQPRISAGRFLAAERLDHDALRRALDLEFERSLTAVGIRLESFALPDAGLPLLGNLWLGRSAKLAIQRALKARTGRGRARRLDSMHLLVGILSAEGGTVARALAAIEIDRTALLTQARAALERAA